MKLEELQNVMNNEMELRLIPLHIALKCMYSTYLVMTSLLFFGIWTFSACIYWFLKTICLIESYT